MRTMPLSRAKVVAMQNDAPRSDLPEHPERSPAVDGCAVLFGALVGACKGIGGAYLLFLFLLKVVGLNNRDCIDCFLVAAALFPLLGAAVGAWITWRKPFPPEEVL